MWPETNYRLRWHIRIRNKTLNVKTYVDKWENGLAKCHQLSNQYHYARSKRNPCYSENEQYRPQAILFSFRLECKFHF